MLVDQSLPISLSNVGGIVVDNTLFRLSKSQSIPEMFVIEAKSSPKLHQVEHWKNFKGAGPPKI